MSIRRKIILSFMVIALSIGLLGGLTFTRNIVSAEKIARHEATSIAGMFQLAVRHDLEERGEARTAGHNQSDFQKYVEQYKKLQRRDLAIVNMHQRIIAGTIRSEVGNIFDKDENDEVALTLEDGRTRFFVEKNIDHPMGIKQMVIAFDNSANERIGAIIMEYTPLYNEIVTGIRSEAKKYLAYFAAALLFAICLGYHLSRNISTALSTMNQAALAIADGKFDTRLTHQWTAELGLLANTFNAMAANLQHSNQELRQSNAMLAEESGNLKISAAALKKSEEKFRVLFENATERKLAENERQALDERLRQTQKMEAIGTLSSGIAHDFNNILSAITGFSQLALVRHKESDAWQEDIRQVIMAAGRATDLVRQILTFSRQQQQEKSPVQLSNIITEAIKLLRASIPSTIDIQQEITSEATVLADATQIHQVIMNLCTNAYHAMMKQGGVIKITLQETFFDQSMLNRRLEETLLAPDMPPGPYLTLAVSDTGCGMSPETMAKIFEPYFTTKETGKGTGLGLAVVYGIVNSHHGLISVHSEPGQGTTFTVSLPIIAPRATNEIVEIAPPMARANERVMIVDDESCIRDYTTLFLNEAGYQAKSFSNGLEAWQAFSQAPGDWDIIITDKTMPEMSGEQLTAKVLAVRPDLPVIICSGHYSGERDKKESSAAGVFSSLQKPIDFNLLLTHIAKALAEKT